MASANLSNAELGLHHNARNLHGQRFGMLVVEGVSGSDRNAVAWTCICDCGGTCVAPTAELTRKQRGKVDCGCMATTRRSKCKITHGMSRTSECKIWDRMISRCHNQADSSYHRYGARGICVCDRWRESFNAFLADIGARPSRGHSIDREDNSGNYEPGNCRWATRKEQQRNKRNNRLLTFNGETLSIAEWAERLRLKPWTIQNRLQYGWTVERALSALIDYRNHKLTHNGETMSISEWTKRLGFSSSTIGARLRRGWSVKNALTTPLANR